VWRDPQNGRYWRGRLEAIAATISSRSDAGRPPSMTATSTDGLKRRAGDPSAKRASVPEWEQMLTLATFLSPTVGHYSPTTKSVSVSRVAPCSTASRTDSSSFIRKNRWPCRVQWATDSRRMSPYSVYCSVTTQYGSSSSATTKWSRIQEEYGNKTQPTIDV